MTKKHQPPPTRFGLGAAPLQAKAAPARPQHAPPPTRFAPAAAQAKTAVPAVRHAPPATRFAADTRQAAAIVQPMMPSGGLPLGIGGGGGYRVIPWQKHRDEVDKGADQIGLRAHHLNQGITDASKSVALIIPTEDFSTRRDQEFLELSAMNIEKQIWNNTKRINKNLSQGKPIRSDLAKQTEVIGEAAAFIAMAKRDGFVMAFATDPGHGAGIDQLWVKSNRDGKVNTYLVVEAKGPGATLASGQMSQLWIETRIDTLTRSSDPEVAAVAAEVALALQNGPGDGTTVPFVRGVVYTADWDTVNCTLGTKTSYASGTSKGKYN